MNAWVLLSDPFTIDTEKLVAALAESYPGTPIMGGMASAFPGGRSAYLFEGANLAPGGALLLAVGGAWTVHPVVSQGAAPIDEGELGEIRAFLADPEGWSARHST